MSETKTTLAERLFEFQKESFDIVKSKEAYGYSYAPLEAILPIIKPFLIKHRIGFFHTTGYDTDSKVNLLSTTLYNVDNTKDTLTSTTAIDDTVKLAKMNTFMVIGSAMTYFRRYQLVCMLGLLTEADTDANGAKPASGTVEGAKQENNGPDFVKIFENLLNKGKAEEIIKKSLSNYEKAMSNEEHEIITTMIQEKFNKK